MTKAHLCRFCHAHLTTTFVDLGLTPLANSYVTQADIDAGHDQKYPLHARVCDACLLVQAEDSVPPDAIFSDYAYFSSYSDSWVEHARHYADAMIARFGLGAQSQMVEIASNDGYLLQHFKARGVPVLGVEPAANVAAVATAKGIDTEVGFFGSKTAQELVVRGIQADMMAANNVLAHVPEIADFVRGFAILLKPEGVATFEFPHVLNLIRQVQFDTIYHEHFSYLSLYVVEKIAASVGLRAFDVEELPTHGGSLRVYVCHEAAAHVPTEALTALRAKEAEAKLNQLAGYTGFAAKVEKVKASFSAFLAQAKAAKKTVGAYGAAAKGNTFLNVCHLNASDIPYVFDRSTAKQGKLLPGSHIPIFDPKEIDALKPDYLVILPWNLTDEISGAFRHIAAWGGRFVVAVPETRILQL